MGVWTVTIDPAERHEVELGARQYIIMQKIERAPAGEGVTLRPDVAEGDIILENGTPPVSVVLETVKDAVIELSKTMTTKFFLTNKALFSVVVSGEWEVSDSIELHDGQALPTHADEEEGFDDEDEDDSEERLKELQDLLLGNTPAAMKAAMDEMIEEAWHSVPDHAAAGIISRAERQKIADKEAYEHALTTCSPANKYIDTKFKAAKSSLTYAMNKRQDGPVNAGEDVSSNWETLVWLRPERFLKPGLKPVMWDKKPNGDVDIEPSDIAQGELGDCYLLSSLSVLAERESTVEKLFKTDLEQPECGLYVVRLCLQGHWHQILLSDEIPCYDEMPGSPDVAGPMFSRGKGDEMWVMILEKAWAKAFGTYQHIIYGLPGECLTNLTGAPCKYVPRTRDDLWEKVYEACTCEKGVKSKEWHVVALMPAMHEHDLQKELGLVEGHAYGVLDARKINGTKLLQLRNPWGNTEWKGAWGDNDTKSWTLDALTALANGSGISVAEVRQEMGRDDGCFWISAADFCKYFAGVQICRDSVGWKHHSEDLKARSGHINVMMLTVTGGPLEADISVHQKDQRAYMAEPGYPGEDKFEYMGVKIMILEAESCELVASWPLTDLRDVWCEAKGLATGKYWVLIETDWDGKKTWGIETDRATGKDYLPLAVSVLYEPVGMAMLLAPVHCKKLNGHMLKMVMLRKQCEKATGNNIVRYDSIFDGVDGASSITKTYYDGTDTYAWLYKNSTKDLKVTETVPFVMTNLAIDGADPSDTQVVVELAPGESKMVVLKQIKAGKILHWTSEPDVQLEEV